jgi:hypothetical protein
MAVRGGNGRKRVAKNGSAWAKTGGENGWRKRVSLGENGWRKTGSEPIATFFATSKRCQFRLTRFWVLDPVLCHVGFYNCTFELSTNLTCQRLAQAIPASPSVEFSELQTQSPNSPAKP